MPAGGVTGYAAINARVRVKYASLLSASDYAALSEAADFDALITVLKHTAYGPYLEAVKDKDLTPRRVTYELKGRLADSYKSIIQTAPGNTKPLVAQLYRFFEVDNLKAVLRGIVTGASWDRVRYVLFPIGEGTDIPAQEMLEAGSVASAGRPTSIRPTWSSNTWASTQTCSKSATSNRTVPSETYSPS